MHGECRYWTVTLDGAKVAGRAVDLAATTAIMDSGTTAILVSSADAAAIHQVRALPAVPCLGCIDAVPGQQAVQAGRHLTYRNHDVCVESASHVNQCSTLTDGLRAGYLGGGV